MRPRRASRQRAMIHRHERRALPARRDIGGAEIIDHRHAESRARARAPSPIWTVSRPPADAARSGRGSRPRRSSSRSMPLAARNVSHRLGMQRGHQRLGLGEHAGAVRCGCSGAAAHRAAQQRTLVVRIGTIARSGRSARSSRRRSRSARHRRRPARCRSSARWRDHGMPRSAATFVLNPAPDLLHHRPAAANMSPERAMMSDYKSDFLHVLAERGFIHQVSEPDALDALARDAARSPPISASTAPRPRCMSARCCRS